MRSLLSYVAVAITALSGAVVARAPRSRRMATIDAVHELALATPRTDAHGTSYIERVDKEHADTGRDLQIVHWPQEFSYWPLTSFKAEYTALSLPKPSRQMTNAERMRRGLGPKKPARLFDGKRRAALAPRWSGAPQQDASGLWVYQGCYDTSIEGANCVDGFCALFAIGQPGDFGSTTSQSAAQRNDALSACIQLCANNGFGGSHVLIGFQFSDDLMVCDCGTAGIEGTETDCTNAQSNLAGYARI